MKNSFCRIMMLCKMSQAINCHWFTRYDPKVLGQGEKKTIS